MGQRTLLRDKWFKLIEEQEKSGLSPSAFCKERQLNLAHMHHYRYYLKKFKAKTNEIAQEKLVPVKLKPKQDSSAITSEIRLILTNGIQCILPSQIEIAHIKLLVEVLMSC